MISALLSLASTATVSHVSHVGHGVGHGHSISHAVVHAAPAAYDSFSDVGGIRVYQRADFQSGSRVLKKVF